MDETELRGALSRVSWVTDVVVLDETPSTNDEALSRASNGAPGGTVVVAERQTAGRGRLGRSWFSEPGAALTASWIVRPANLPPDLWSLIPLAAGVAAAEAVIETSNVDVRLKWPNDVLARGRKLGGILVEARPPDAAVVGLGVNLSGRLPDELATTATTITTEGGRVNGAALLAKTLDAFGRLIDEHEALLPRYRALCATLGAEVRVSRSDGSAIEGVARDVDARGALVVERDGATTTVSAGDVVHVRNAVW